MACRAFRGGLLQGVQAGALLFLEVLKVLQRVAEVFNLLRNLGS